MSHCQKMDSYVYLKGAHQVDVIYIISPYLFNTDRPGFGVTLNRDGLERPYSRTAEQVKMQFDKNSSLPVQGKAKMPF